MMMGPNNMLSGRGQTLVQQAALDRVNQAVLIGGLTALTAALAIGSSYFAPSPADRSADSRRPSTGTGRSQRARRGG